MLKSGKKTFIKNIKLKNFKSFNNSIEIGPFHPDLNAILGSNGSGKSNIIDSVLFTFGRKANTLRSMKLVNLIHSFDEEHRLFASSSIFLKFEKTSKKKFLKKTKEICISRKIFQNKKSIYYLNGKESKFLFLKRFFLFWKTPIERGIFSIKQGEIEQYSKMESSGKFKKKKGLIEFIEYISDSSCYFRLIFRKLKFFFKFKFEKNFCCQIQSKNQIGEIVLFGEKKNSFLLDKVKKLFFSNITFIKFYSAMSSKILNLKISTFISKKVLILSKRIKCEVFIKLYTLKKNFRFYNEINKQVFHIHTREDFFNFLLKPLLLLFFLKEKMNLKKNFSKCNNEKITRKILKFFSYSWYFCSKRNLKLAFKFTIYKVVSKLNVFFDFVKLLKLKNFEFFHILPTFLNNFIKYNRIKLFTEINESYLQGWFTKSKSKNGFSKFNQNLISYKYNENYNNSVFFNLTRTKLNYSLKKQRNKFDLCEKIEINLKLWGTQKFQILKKKFGKFNDFCGFLCFTKKSFSQGIGSFFSYQSNCFIYKNQHVFLSELIYFRYNVRTRIKFLCENEVPISLNIGSIGGNHYNRFLYKKLFLFSRNTNVLQQFFEKFYLINYLKKNNLFVKKRIYKVKSVDTNCKISNFKRNFLRLFILKNILVFFFTKKKLMLEWIVMFTYFYIEIFPFKKIIIINKNNRYKKRTTGYAVFQFNSNLPNFRTLPYDYRKNIGYKTILVKTGNFFYRTLNNTTSVINSKTVSKFLFGKHQQKSFEVERRRIFFSTRVDILFILNLIRSDLKDKYIYFYGGTNMSKQANGMIFKVTGNCIYRKSLFLQKILKKRGRKSDKIFLKKYKKIKEFIYTIFIFLTEDIFIKNSIETYLSQIILRIICRFKSKSTFFELSKLTNGSLWKIFRVRLRNIKIQIFKYFQLNTFLSGPGTFPILEKAKSTFFSNPSKHYFHKLLTGIPNSKKNKKISFYYLKNKIKLNFITLWNILSIFFKKIYFLKKLGQLKTNILKNKNNQLIFKNVHLIKNTDVQTCITSLNKTINEEYQNIKKTNYMELVSVDNCDLFNKGLKLIIFHKNKRIHQLSQMSGGEKALSSICLILSSRTLLPLRWFIFDEIDAALDFKNISKISLMLKYQIKCSQILIITLRNNMIMIINHVFGIYKLRDNTKIISLRV